MKNFSIVNRISLYWLAGLGILVSLTLVIRPESLWLDELSTAWLAFQPTWGDFLKQLGSLGSEAQMPCYVVWLWVWAHFFGVGEWVLRASNIPWAILAIVSWIGLLKKNSCGVWAMGLLMSPFLCYYMNEARPYVMTFATSLFALYAVESLCTAPLGSCGAWEKVALVAGLGLCAGASMLNLILVPGLVAYGVLRLVNTDNPCGLRRWIRCHAGTLGCIFILLCGISVYYVGTLMLGHGGQREPFTWINAAYAFYEILGFGGLGPPRIMFRELSVASIFTKYGSALLCGLMVWGWVAWVLWTCRRNVFQCPVIRATLTGLVLGVLLLVVFAIGFKVSLWGRHFIVMMPFLFLGLAVAVDTIRRDAPLRAKSAILGLITLFVISSARQRVLDEHRKDPIREAVAALGTLAMQTPEVPVVLLTSPLASWYYGHDISATLIPVLGWTEVRSRRWQMGRPEYIILVHRADKFDPQGVWTYSLSDGHAKLLWQEGNIKILRVGVAPVVKGIL